MRTTRRGTIEELRLAIDCLPRRSRLAMLEGIRSNPVIVGAYSDQDGICPMLAAHRAGGRTNLIAFARAWDRFASRSSKTTRPRRATARELLVLRTHLEASLLADEGWHDELAAAIADHARLVRRGRRGEARPGDPDRSRELSVRPGWSWTRVVRRYDDYERALADAHASREAARQRDLVLAR